MPKDIHASTTLSSIFEMGAKLIDQNEKACFKLKNHELAYCILQKQNAKTLYQWGLKAGYIKLNNIVEKDPLEIRSSIKIPNLFKVYFNYVNGNIEYPDLRKEAHVVLNSPSFTMHIPATTQESTKEAKKSKEKECIKRAIEVFCCKIQFWIAQLKPLAEIIKKQSSRINSQEKKEFLEIYTEMLRYLQQYWSIWPKFEQYIKDLVDAQQLSKTYISSQIDKYKKYCLKRHDTLEKLRVCRNLILQSEDDFDEIADDLYIIEQKISAQSGFVVSLFGAYCIKLLNEQFNDIRNTKATSSIIAKFSSTAKENENTELEALLALPIWDMYKGFWPMEWRGLHSKIPLNDSSAKIENNISPIDSVISFDSDKSQSDVHSFSNCEEYYEDDASSIISLGSLRSQLQELNTSLNNRP